MTDSEFSAINWMGYRPRIECRGADTLPLDAIEDFQGALKKRSKRDVEKIMRSIYEYGFSFPFACWMNQGHVMCLDGHGRGLALNEMRKRGADLPVFPVVYIEAHDEEEAKQKLLRLNSAYGSMSKASILAFAGDIRINENEIALPGVSFVEEPIAPEAEPSEDITVFVTLHSTDDADDFIAEMAERGISAVIKK